MMILLFHPLKKRVLATIRVSRWLLLGLLLIAVALTSRDPSRRAYAADNPVVIENQQPGSSGWRISKSAADDATGQIKGYASATSVNKGQPITFYVTVNPAQSYTIDVYRIGWYQGSGGRLQQHIGPFNGVQQPTCPTDSTTGLIVCNWAPAYVLNVPTTWTSGVYLALLTNAQNYQSYIIFVVRDDSRVAPLLYQSAFTTFQAYNYYPNNGKTGKSLYDHNSSGANTISGSVRAVKVSFDRPYTSAYWQGATDFMSWELYFVRWIERSGYDVSYSTDVDTHASGSRLLNYKGFLSMAHDEYWSKEMRDAVEAARDAGVNVAFFGADAVYWQIRFEASAGGVPNRVMVCYKDATKDPVQGPTTTVQFRQSPVNRPEQTLMGLQFTSQTQNNGYVSYVVNNSSHWIYAGTGFKDGNTVSGIVGYETDHQFSNFPLPNSVAGSYTLLSRSTYTNYNGASDWANSSIYQAPSGAWVFDAGTIGWSWGLDNYGSHNIADTRIQQTTANLLNKFIGSSPSPPPAIAAPSGLTATAPSSTMVNLAWTDNATNETAYTVERSPDGSTNWTVLASVLAAGATSYSDTTVSALTTYYYRVKATTATSSSNYSNTANITTPGTAPPPPPSSGTSLFIYRDALASGWENWSWGSTLNLTNANPVYAGTASIAFTATGSYGGLYLHNSTGVDTTAYTALSFAAQASQSGQHYGILLYDANSQPLSAVMPLANLGGDPQAGSWTVYTIPLSSLNGAGKLVKGVVIQSSGASAQPALYVDEIGFAGTASSPPPPPTSPPPPPPPPPTGGITVFGDSLAAGWQNWSWSSTINFSNTNPVYAGTASIAFTATGPWGGLYLHTDTAVDTTSVSTLSFAVRASQTGQKYQVALYDANNQLLKATVPLGNYGGDPPPDTWKVYAIPLADLNGAGKLVKGILIQEALGQAQPALYVDELGFR